MSEKETGGPAFPVTGTVYSQDREAFEVGCVDGGMTLRDYFAVHASDEDVKTQIEFIREQEISKHGIGILPDDWHTKARYMHADAMLKARST